MLPESYLFPNAFQVFFSSLKIGRRVYSYRRGIGDGGEYFITILKPAKLLETFCLFKGGNG